MNQRVVLHIGSPVTGIGGIQRRLAKRATQFEAQGWFYPSKGEHEHFLAALDVLNIMWAPPLRYAIPGAWAGMTQRVRSSRMNTLISNEFLTRANEREIRRIAGSFGPAEVSVVITARDLGRQIPAEYQEHVKFRNALTYDTFLERMREPEVDDAAGALARLTWSVQDVPAVAQRWAQVLGNDKVTIVAVPPAGSDPAELERRFAEAVGFDPEIIAGAGVDPNRSLSVPELELIRRLNERESDNLNADAYGFVIERLVNGLQGKVPDGSALTLPSEAYPWVVAAAAERNAALAAAGYRVVGDLDDLLPEQSADYVDPSAASVEDMFAASLQGLAASASEFAEFVRKLPVPEPEPEPGLFGKRKKTAAR